MSPYRQNRRCSWRARPACRLRRHAPGAARNRSAACRSAASTSRAAFEAITVSKCTRLIRRVSTSWACGNGAMTRRIGSSGKNTVPSGNASTSPVKRSPARYSRSRSGNASNARSAAMSSLGEGQIFEIVERLLQAGRHQEAAVRRQLAHEQLENRRIGQPVVEIGRQHVELIKIGQQRRLHRLMLKHIRPTALIWVKAPGRHPVFAAPGMNKPGHQCFVHTPSAHNQHVAGKALDQFAQPIAAALQPSRLRTPTSDNRVRRSAGRRAAGSAGATST